MFSSSAVVSLPVCSPTSTTFILQIVLFGESVDVDVDEPSITIRWSILACGQSFVLPESTGSHGSKVCGLPSTSLKIYVDK
jgi:hypothetical protein